MGLSFLGRGYGRRAIAVHGGGTLGMRLSTQRSTPRVLSHPERPAGAVDRCAEPDLLRRIIAAIEAFQAPGPQRRHPRMAQLLQLSRGHGARIAADVEAVVALGADVVVRDRFSFLGDDVDGEDGWPRSGATTSSRACSVACSPSGAAISQWASGPRRLVSQASGSGMRARSTRAVRARWPGPAGR